MTVIFPGPGVAFSEVELQTGAELRVSGGDRGGRGAFAVICVNGGQAREVEGTWSATIEWLVGRMSPLFPGVRFAEVRYRIKSWRRFDWCVDDTQAAIEAVGAERTIMLGFSMGGGVSIAAASEPSVEAVIALSPWIPPRLPMDALRGRRLAVIHGALDRPLPGIPGVHPRTSRAGFERALTLGVEGDYRLVAGGLHGVAVRLPALGLVPLPKARTWARLVAAEIERTGAPVPAICQGG